MGEKETKENTVELWGNIFNKVEFGLDENEVNAYIKKLVGERDKLLNRQEHLSALAELAEKTVTEADKMAERIKEEAKVQAEEEAKEILAEAEKQAQELVEEQTSEAVANAQKDIETMKLDAQKHSQEFLKDSIEKLQINIMDVIDETFKEMVAQAESLHKEEAYVEDEPDNPSSNHDNGGNGKVKEYKEVINNKIDSSEPDKQAVKNEAAEEEQDNDAAEEEQPVLKTDWWATEDQEWAVLEFLPPRDQDGIEHIQQYIDNLPEVNTTEIDTMVDKTWIKVLINKENDLIKKLGKLPEIQQIYEVEEDEYKKFEIELDLTSSIDMSRNKLNRNFSNILSKQR